MTTNNMLNVKKGQPRRPLVLEPQSRDILNSIRDNLTAKNPPTRQQSTPVTTKDSPDYGTQQRHDSVSSGSSNPTVPKSNSTSHTKRKDKYVDKALDEIRKALHPFKTDSGNGQDAGTLEGEDTYDKDKVIGAIKAGGNHFETALQKNGMNKVLGTNRIPGGRKHSLGTASPGSDSASTRSESPSLSSLQGFPRTTSGSLSSDPGKMMTSNMPGVMSPPNGLQTPPPVPPRLPLGSTGVQTPPTGNQTQSPGRLGESYISNTSLTPATVYSSTPNHISHVKKMISGVSPGMSPLANDNSIKNVPSMVIQSSTPNIHRVTSQPVVQQQTRGSPMLNITPNMENGRPQSVHVTGSPGTIGISSPKQSVTISYQSARPPPPPYPQGQGSGSPTVQIIQRSRAASNVDQSRLLQNVRSIQIDVGQRKPAQAWPTSQPQIVTQQVTSREVTKPQVQKATGPHSNVSPAQQTGQKYISSVERQLGSPIPIQQTQQQRGKVQISIHAPNHPQMLNGNGRLTPDQYINQPGQQQQQQHGQRMLKIQIEGGSPYYTQNNPAGFYDNRYYQGTDTPLSTPRSGSPISLSRHNNQSPLSISSNPSTNSDIPDRPPPPYPGRPLPVNMTKNLQNQGSPGNIQIVQPIPQNPTTMGYHVPQIVSSQPHGVSRGQATAPQPRLQQQQYQQQQQQQQQQQIAAAANQPPLPPRVPIMQSNKGPAPSQPQSGVNNESQPPVPPKGFINNNLPLANISNEQNETDTDLDSMSTTSDMSLTQDKRTCTSPIPELKSESDEKDILRRDTLVRNYSPQAYKFYMEQHIENLMKNYNQRQTRRLQLEKEMEKIKLSDDAQTQMRRMLQQKESNYIRMKRSKMNKDMFEKIKTLGVGAFGEVALVQKRDVYQLYAMKTLGKMDVLKRNQVAHVKAERDILAEADNEWVVKLYYSFQDMTNLYFVMDYVPGGDLMGLLIKFGIFEENLARFYIAELVLAIESVHKMGFIHRDIKPDNILIDREGHIKLTDFGLCTGFRWTHNSKYYQKDGVHPRQDSMDVSCLESPMSTECKCPKVKTLERRKIRDHQRCLAHSLVGTPNYIAPEVLLRQGYTSCCDWWSVGVILYEMVIGQPPFYAQTPQETQYKVINWNKTLTIPPKPALSQSTVELIINLCCGSETRLGKKGASEIKTHPFFESIKFPGLRQQKALYVPKIRHDLDTSNFDEVEETDDDSDLGHYMMKERPENGKHPEHAFFEFTFRRFFDDGGRPFASVKNDKVAIANDKDETESNSESNAPVYV